MALPFVLPDAFSSTPWRLVQRSSFTRVEEVISFLELSNECAALIDTRPGFPFLLPRRLAEKIPKNRLDDPLFRQFIPLREERTIIPGFLADPVCDRTFAREGRLLHKYAGRALLVVAGCAMHCRYCFRQNYDYAPTDDFSEALSLIKSDSSIEEVILSGGDPLSLSDRGLKNIFDALAEMAHVKRIRFHTRFPMGIPERIDASFCELLASSPKQIWFMVHTNHAREFDNDIWEALRRIQMLAIPVLSQSVLLKGVNDDVETLAELFCTLVDHGITPYYLNQLDRVQGAAHFEVPVEEGKLLIQKLQKRLSGYAVPRYAQELPGQPSKTWL